MVFWQLTIDRERPRSAGALLGTGTGLPADAAGLVRHYLAPSLPEKKAGKNRLHLDLYPTGRDDDLPLGRRIEILEANVSELVGLGARVERRTRGDDPDGDPFYYLVMHDPVSPGSVVDWSDADEHA